MNLVYLEVITNNTTYRGVFINSRIYPWENKAEIFEKYGLKILTVSHRDEGDLTEYTGLDIKDRLVNFARYLFLDKDNEFIGEDKEIEKWCIEIIDWN